jgi:N-methylhydantoinase A
MATRLGIDVGGTFTDLVFYDDRSGDVRIGKVPTTSSSPQEGVKQSITTLLSPEEIGGSEYFIHGTTVGINTILQRSGPVIGLLCTSGFRDVLEIRRTARLEPYELFPKERQRPLVPRSLRRPITERMLASGEVMTPLDPADVQDAFATFEEAGVTTVAICFLNSYANGSHELEAAKILRESGFDGEISLSHEVSGEYREYERTATTVIDSYLRPSLRVYLQDVEQALGNAGFDGERLMVKPDGGAITFSEAENRAFETIISGPVGGVQGACELARALDLDGDIITADVGGTSFDTAVVSNGEPHLLYQGEIATMPVQTPWVDVRSIGAGGGSVAYVDQGGLLRVGPRSAGAYPGPACYGRGGTEPTVTDAALLLGMLPSVLASGLELDRARAETALASVAEPLGLDVTAASRGIMVIAAASMAGAMGEITVQQGRDPRTCTLLAFGGAGPLFATLLTGELQIPEIVVPPYAGNFSAWGMLGADLVRTATRTHVMNTGDEDLVEASRLLSELFTTLEHRGTSEGRHFNQEAALDMRYHGQEHTVTIPVPWEDGKIQIGQDELRERFSQEYLKAFSYTLEFDPEIETLRATEREKLPRRKVQQSNGVATTSAEADKRERAYSFSRDEWLEFAHIDPSQLHPGAVIEGPAIILEETATIYVDAGFSGSIDESGALRLKSESS